jgi:hypothetical protein
MRGSSRDDPPKEHNLWSKKKAKVTEFDILAA